MANYQLNYTGEEINALLAKIQNLNLTPETWTFIREDGTPIPKVIYTIPGETSEEIPEETSEE